MFHGSRLGSWPDDGGQGGGPPGLLRPVCIFCGKASFSDPFER
jgi:hypothetical protein